MKLLITGGSGMVGGSIAAALRATKDIDVLAPDRTGLDITDTVSVSAYFRLHAPDAVVHAAAFTDNDKAEYQRNNPRGECYRVNVEGTGNISEMVKQYGAYLVYISTGSVFFGTPSGPGPFTESDTPGPASSLSWYAACKLRAEQTAGADAAVIRISHPSGVSNSRKQDYVTRMLTLYDERRLYPLFTDQYFPVSDIGDIIRVVKALLGTRNSGIYHVVSETMTTPYALMTYVCNQTGRNPAELQAVEMRTFLASADRTKRYSQFSAIDGARTREIFGLPRRTWQEIIGRTVIHS